MDFGFGFAAVIIAGLNFVRFGLDSKIKIKKVIAVESDFDSNNWDS